MKFDSFAWSTTKCYIVPSGGGSTSGTIFPGTSRFGSTRERNCRRTRERSPLPFRQRNLSQQLSIMAISATIFDGIAKTSVRKDETQQVDN